MAELKPIVINGNKKAELDADSDCLPLIEQSGRYFVPSGEIYRVKENYQSTNFGGLQLDDGCLYVDGQLTMEH
jgi:hypothetical protein